MEREFSQAEKALMRWSSMLFDMVVIALGIITMFYVVYLIWLLVNEILNGLPVDDVLQGIVVIMIFLEVFEIIALYFMYHHVSMKNIVEIGVLAMVKELLITLDLHELGWQTMIAAAALIAVMGAVYVFEMRRIDQHEEFLLTHGKNGDRSEE